MQGLFAARGALREEFGLTVILISFNTPEAALQWNCDAHVADMQHLCECDPSRPAYRLFGLQRSLEGVYSYRAISFYADQLLAGRALPLPPAPSASAPTSPHAPDDVFQMGGDFLLLAHPPPPPAPANALSPIPPDSAQLRMTCKYACTGVHTLSHPTQPCECVRVSADAFSCKLTSESVMPPPPPPTAPACASAPCGSVSVSSVRRSSSGWVAETADEASEQEQEGKGEEEEEEVPIASAGRVLLAHYSSVSTDRPTLDSIKHTLRHSGWECPPELPSTTAIGGVTVCQNSHQSGHIERDCGDGRDTAPSF